MIKNTSLLFVLITGLVLSGCGKKGPDFDATGTFEANEVLVSSELSGRIDSLSVEEGQQVAAGRVVGRIDALNLALQKEQVEASIDALQEKTMDVQPQIKLLQHQVGRAKIAAGYPGAGKATHPEPPGRRCRHRQATR